MSASEKTSIQRKRKDGKAKQLMVGSVPWVEWSLNKQGLSTARAVQFGYRRCICWRSFRLSDVLGKNVLELLAQRKQAFAAVGCEEAKVAHLDEAFG